MQLKSVISKKLIKYPKDEELMVEFYTDLPIGIVNTLQDETISNINRMIFFVKHIVSDWNFADENGNKLEIQEENIKLLNTELVTWIVNQGSELIKPDTEKKKI